MRIIDSGFIPNIYEKGMLEGYQHKLVKTSAMFYKFYKSNNIINFYLLVNKK